MIQNCDHDTYLNILSFHSRSFKLMSKITLKSFILPLFTVYALLLCENVFFAETVKSNTEWEDSCV
jgi:hypothetical protein